MTRPADIRQSVMVADIEQTLREWNFQGGPPRVDRWAGEHTTAYALLRGAFSALIWVPVLWLAVPEDTPWLAWVAGILIVVAWITGFVLIRRATAYTAAALREWDARHERA